jgi:regulator of protease activity HflC (stomatin/prohibitin superfamily)
LPHNLDEGAAVDTVIQNQAATVTERPGRAFSGVTAAVTIVVTALSGLALIALAPRLDQPFLAVIGVLLIIAAIICVAGLYMLQPNQAAVLTFFGDYRGTDRTAGARWTNPLYRRAKVSLRVRNFSTATSKVNDANGNPIQVAAVVVWQVVDTARAAFDVDDFVHYVMIQAEAAVRHMARSYPYDSFEDTDTVTLVGDVNEVNHSLSTELQERLGAAGVTVLEARLTDLSYAPEIAEAMLRRQQASAVVAARRKIVEGAVWMVRDAVRQLEQGATGDDAIPLDPDRRATFAANLMTVIASDAPTSPVVNVGTLAR